MAEETKIKMHIVIASINELKNIESFKQTLLKHDATIIVIDEGDLTIRRRNNMLLDGLKYRYYGPIERKEWFRDRFGENFQRFLEIIPERCHAETSFGFLIAYEEDADVVIELDDDVFGQNNDFVEGHLSNLYNDSGVTVNSQGKWYNTI